FFHSFLRFWGKNNPTRMDFTKKDRQIHSRQFPSNSQQLQRPSFATASSMVFLIEIGSSNRMRLRRIPRTVIKKIIVFLLVLIPLLVTHVPRLHRDCPDQRLFHPFQESLQLSCSFIRDLIKSKEIIRRNLTKSKGKSINAGGWSGRRFV
ncbi:MAG: hypothetical protein II040_02535, partial [Muribaculaceae bacterium]|nr:hypothetical protein [Muribaculaceae bacterium]